MSADSTAAESSKPAPAKPPRRWYQFSLRTFAILMLLVGVGFGTLGRQIHRAREQSAKVTALRSLGATIEYEGEFKIDDRGTVWFFGEFRPWWKQERPRLPRAAA